MEKIATSFLGHQTEKASIENPHIGSADRIFKMSRIKSKAAASSFE